jgi:hypothetical protein
MAHANVVPHLDLSHGGGFGQTGRHVYPHKVPQGAVAQLVARLVRIEEARGSNPLSSTIGRTPCGARPVCARIGRGASLVDDSTNNLLENVITLVRQRDLGCVVNKALSE